MKCLLDYNVVSTRSCFSDEQLLQEDGSDESNITTEFSKAMHLSSADSSVGVGRFNRTSSASSNIPIQRWIIALVDLLCFILKNYVYG